MSTKPTAPPNRRFGVTKRLAAWVYFNMSVGDTVKMRHLREVISNGGAPNTDEHFNRRFRELRDAGWALSSIKEDGTLGIDEYRLDKVGLRIWLEEERRPRATISQRLRRQVFERDQFQCQVCGCRAGEEYPGEPGSRVRITAGHIRAKALDGTVDLINLRTECARCNEPMRDEASIGFGLNEIWPSVRRLGEREKLLLLRWLESGHRPPSELLQLFDSIRQLDPDEIVDIMDRLHKATAADGMITELS